MEQTAFCTSCGEEVNEAAEICPSCGVRRHGNSTFGGNLSSDSDLGSAIYVLRIAFGGLFLLAVPGALMDPTMGIVSSILTAVALLVLGVVLIPQLNERARNRHRHGWTDFGEVSSVDETTIQSSNKPCTSCNGPVSPGVRRTYKKENVVLGFSLNTSESGENVYCQACANGEMSPVSMPASSAEA